MTVHKHRFGDLLKEARNKADQTPDVMAILLSVDPDDYAAMESGTRFPDDETLKRLCMMMEWNYLETARMIRNEMASTSRAMAMAASSEGSALEGHPLNPDGTPGSGKVESLGSRLKDVRLLTGQSMEIIGALLNIGAPAYQRLEEGESPSDELLRRISMIYNWNYYDLQAILRTEQARQHQPRRVGSPFPSASHRTERLRTVCREIEAVFHGAPDAEQEMMLAQLELIRATLRRHRRSEPAPQAAPPPGMAATGQAPVSPTTHRRKSSLNPPLPGISDRKIFPA